MPESSTVWIGEVPYENTMKTKESTFEAYPHHGGMCGTYISIIFGLEFRIRTHLVEGVV